MGNGISKSGSTGTLPTPETTPGASGPTEAPKTTTASPDAEEVDFQQLKDQFQTTFSDIGKLIPPEFVPRLISTLASNLAIILADPKGIDPERTDPFKEVRQISWVSGLAKDVEAAAESIRAELGGQVPAGYNFAIHPAQIACLLSTVEQVHQSFADRDASRGSRLMSPIASICALVGCVPGAELFSQIGGTLAQWTGEVEEMYQKQRAIVEEIRAAGVAAALSNEDASGSSASSGGGISLGQQSTNTSGTSGLDLKHQQVQENAIRNAIESAGLQQSELRDNLNHDRNNK